MKPYLNSLSFLLFLVSVVSYLIMLVGVDSFLFLSLLSAAIGLAISFFGTKKPFRIFCIASNAVMVFLVIGIPFIVTTFFWNTP